MSMGATYRFPTISNMFSSRDFEDRRMSSYLVPNLPQVDQYLTTPAQDLAEEGS